MLRYRGSEGMLAWAFHRISGVAIWAVHPAPRHRHLARRARTRTLYDDVLRVLREPAGRVLEVLLGAALLYHALNGLRIIIMDFWPRDDRYHRQLWYAYWVMFVLVGMPGRAPDHGAGLRVRAAVHDRGLTHEQPARPGPGIARGRQGGGWELAVWYLMRLTGLGAVRAWRWRTICILHFLSDPAAQNADWIATSAGTTSSGGLRLADAHARAVPRVHGHADGRRRLHPRRRRGRAAHDGCSTSLRDRAVRHGHDRRRHAARTSARRR